MKKPAKARYRVTNWREYNESLVRRGDITLWFGQDALDAWEHANRDVKVGRPFTYSDSAIECLLTLRELFRLPYRQTEGLGRALAQLMNIELPIPSFTLLAKRAARLHIGLNIRQLRGPIDVVIDSTGLKVFGEGDGVRPPVKRPSGGPGASCICRSIPRRKRSSPRSSRRAARETPRRRFLCSIKSLRPWRNFTPMGLTIAWSCTSNWPIDRSSR